MHNGKSIRRRKERREENHEMDLSMYARKERRASGEKVVQLGRNSLLTEALNDDKSCRKESKKVREEKRINY